MKEGDEVIIKLIDGEVRITTQLQELRRAQAYVADDDQTAWSEELIAERRVEAQRE